MNRAPIILLCCAVAGLTGCAISFGDHNGAESRGVAQDIGSTRDAGPTSGDRAAPMMQ